ncbi:hypothetical protein CWD88_28460 [Burkholderia pseudomallei]|uniref:Uncharacterized protein n=1 Tax=Burkholderia pseudomallei TaxID=28450 RepID=A0AAX0U3Q0_BURPE|nr:hypothetical protein CWD88_28460 [Burkholderia pseudomallei]
MRGDALGARRRTLHFRPETGTDAERACGGGAPHARGGPDTRGERGSRGARRAAYRARESGCKSGCRPDCRSSRAPAPNRTAAYRVRGAAAHAKHADRARTVPDPAARAVTGVRRCGAR